jgi:hypothetical protein
MKKMITFLAGFALVLALAPTAQATTIEFFTDSDQLNLAGRDVLAAVNLYAPTDRSVQGHAVVTSIQSQAFTNFDEDDFGTQQTVTQGTLDSGPGALAKGGRENPLSLTGTAPDVADGNLLGGKGWFTATDPGDLDMTFNFDGVKWADQEVEIQMIGGGTAPKDRLPVLDVYVAADVGDEYKGTFIDNDGSADHTSTGAGNPYLMTFTTTLDSAGDLFIDVDYNITTPGAGDIHLMAVMVTVAGPSATPGTLIFVQ